jgi:hypothetical protein
MFEEQMHLFSLVVFFRASVHPLRLINFQIFKSSMALIISLNVKNISAFETKMGVKCQLQDQTQCTFNVEIISTMFWWQSWGVVNSVWSLPQSLQWCGFLVCPFCMFHNMHFCDYEKAMCLLLKGLILIGSI